MPATPSRTAPWKAASLSLSTAGQTSEKLKELIGVVLSHGGCLGCGRMIRFEVEFADDPGPELTKMGVTSVEAE